MVTRQLGTFLDNNSLSIAVSFRLANDIICHPHLCVCYSYVGSDGHHGLSSLNNFIMVTLISAEVPFTIEPSGLCRTRGKRVNVCFGTQPAQTSPPRVTYPDRLNRPDSPQKLLLA